MTNAERTFEVGASRLLELEDAYNELQALGCAGVDNWEGCDDVEWPEATSMKDLEEQYKETTKKEA